VNDVPMINNIGIATMSPTDHLPNVVFGIILQYRHCDDEPDRPLTQCSFWHNSPGLFCHTIFLSHQKTIHPIDFALMQSVLSCFPS
jgi:hypothetical protein